MSSMAFDSLRFARRLRNAGVPEPQADAHAELMAESLSHFAENLLTKDHFEVVLDARFAEQDARLDRRFAEMDNRFVEVDKRFEEVDKRFGEVDKRFGEVDKRFGEVDKHFGEFDKHFGEFDKHFSEQDVRFEQRFSKLERTLAVHTWMLGILVLVMVVPQLQEWLT